MADVFLSYSKSDLETAGSIAAAIEAEGFSVWWDYDLTPGKKFNEIIGEALRIARAVIVLWSPRSVSSAWVREEASQGLSRGILIPVLIDQVEIPLGFHQLQHANLVGWSGKTTDPAWIRFRDALTRRLGRPSRFPPVDAPRPPPSPASPVPEVAPGERLQTPMGRKFHVPKGASRTSLFIAHASADKPRLRGLMQVLIDAGFPLWIDKPHHIGLPLELEKKIGRIQMGQIGRQALPMLSENRELFLRSGLMTQSMENANNFTMRCFKAWLSRSLINAS